MCPLMGHHTRLPKNEVNDIINKLNQHFLSNKFMNSSSAERDHALKPCTERKNSNSTPLAS